MIGGTLAYPPSTALQSATPVHLRIPGLGYYANARSALYALLATSLYRSVWVPSFVCPSVLEPMHRAALPIHFYPVSDRLDLQDDAWTHGLGANDLVVAIRYFGFPSISLPDPSALRGAEILEDLSQALYAPPRSDAHWAIYSPRKFLPVPDGGILVARPPHLVPQRYADAADQTYFLDGLHAICHRALFDRGVLRSRDWHLRYQDAERAMPTGLAPMSMFSRAVMEFGTDHDTVCARRRANYSTLANKLGDWALRPVIGDAIPLGFPMVCANRDEVRQALFRDEIYPPVHWDIRDVVPPEFRPSHHLSHQIMTLPCDQRYGPEDMLRMADLIASVAQPPA